MNHTIEDVSIVGQPERIRNPAEQRALLQTQGSPMNETVTSFNFQKRSKDVRTQGGRNRGYIPNTATNSTTIDGSSYEMSSVNNNNPALFLQSASQYQDSNTQVILSQQVTPQASKGGGRAIRLPSL